MFPWSASSSPPPPCCFWIVTYIQPQLAQKLMPRVHLISLSPTSRCPSLESSLWQSLRNMSHGNLTRCQRCQSWNNPYATELQHTWVSNHIVHTRPQGGGQMLPCPWSSAHKSYHLDILKHAYSKLLGGLEFCFTPHIAYPLNINSGNYVLPFNTEDPSPHAGDLKSSPRVGKGSRQCNISFPS